MTRPRTFGLIVAAVLGALAVGSAFAFSTSDDAAPSSRAGPTIQEQDQPANAQDEDADDEDGGGGIDKAAVIAEEFDVPPGEVAALREQGIGWGALFKLYAYARVMDVSVDELVADAPADAGGERDHAFGDLKKSLTDEQLAALEDGPKNFGQLVSKSKKPAHAGPP